MSDVARVIQRASRRASFTFRVEDPIEATAWHWGRLGEATGTVELTAADAQAFHDAGGFDHKPFSVRMGRYTFNVIAHTMKIDAGRIYVDLSAVGAWTRREA